MRKTVSVLLLIFLTLAVALFSFTSCKNEPELKPTEAPEPGEIPSIPNNLTTINSLSEEQTKALSTLFGDVGRFFVDYLDTYGYDDNDGPLYDLMNNPQLSFGDATATLSAAASSGKFTLGEGENAKLYEYEHGEVTGYLGVNAKGHVVLCTDTVITTELFGWTAGTKIHVEDTLNEGYSDFFIGEKTDYKTFDIRFDLNGNGFDIYEDGSDTCVNSSTDSEKKYKAALKEKVDFIKFIVTKALFKSTIEIKDVTITDNRLLEDEKTIDDANLATFIVNGTVELSSKAKKVKDPNTNKETDEEVSTYDESYHELSELFSSLSVTVSDLSVQAVVSTKVTTEKKETKSEQLAATLDVTNLSFLIDYSDDETMTLECDKLALSFSDSKDSLLISLELTDLDFDLSSVESNARARHSLSVSLSSTLGLGIKALGTSTENYSTEGTTVENSFGLVTDFGFRFSGLPLVIIDPKAAVINGSFYDTKEVRNLLIDFIEMLLPTAS